MKTKWVTFVASLMIGLSLMSMSDTASAWWRGGYWGWHRGYYHGYHRCGWVPGHWRRGYWIPGHRGC